MNPAPDSSEPVHRSTAQGLLCALLGFAVLSIGDGLVKSMAGQWPGTAIAALRYVYGTVLLGAFILLRWGPSAFAASNWPLQFGRGVAVATAAVCFFFAVQLMPLAEATAIQFTSPIMVALLAPWLLGERTTRIAWLCSILALAGVAIVLRPNLLALGLAAFLPVLAALGMAVLVICNRKLLGTASVVALQFWVAAMAAIVMVPAAVAGQLSGNPFLHVPPPTAIVLLKCFGVAVTGTIGHWLIFVATQRASAPLVAPMVYVQLIVAGLIGRIWFGNRIDLMSGIGMAVIILAGLLLWRNQRNPVVAIPPD